MLAIPICNSSGSMGKFPVLAITDDNNKLFTNFCFLRLKINSNIAI